MRLTAGLLGLTAGLAGAAVADDARPPLLCGGVEPHWSFEITGDRALFTSPETADISYALRDERAARGRDWPVALTFIAPQDTAIALIRRSACSDTMSDALFDWTIDILTQRNQEPVLLTGCCRTRPAD